jgi:hypothetical protein
LKASNTRALPVVDIGALPRLKREQVSLRGFQNCWLGTTADDLPVQLRIGEAEAGSAPHASDDEEEPISALASR